MRRRRKTATPAVARPATAPAPAPSPPHLPALGRVVSVGFEDVSMSWRTRVEVSSGAALVLVAPTRTLGDAIVPDIGRPVIVGWSEEDGYFEAECSLAATGVDTVVTWILTVHRVERLQRRAAFRIETSGPVALVTDGARLEGRLRNVSEGGLCCVLPSSSTSELPSKVTVSVELEELGRFDCESTVLRTSPTTEPGEVEVAVAFDGLDQARVEELRQFVFAEQLRRRRTLSGR